MRAAEIKALIRQYIRETREARKGVEKARAKRRLAEAMETHITALMASHDELERALLLQHARDPDWVARFNALTGPQIRELMKDRKEPPKWDAN